MYRRRFLTSVAVATGAAALSPLRTAHAAGGVSVDELPKLKGKLTLYLGRGEGGLYENVLKAIEERNPELELGIRRGPTAALANAIIAEHGAGRVRADLFWAVDAGAIGMVSETVAPKALPEDLQAQLKDGFRYDTWTPISGRIRTVPYNPERIGSDGLPTSIGDLPETDGRPGWAPSYASFQSFVTAMRLLEGEDATGAWLQAMDRVAKRYAGELGVVMAVERGEVDLGLANHYYTLRLKSGKPDASVELGFTNDDAGCLVNASGVVAITGSTLAQDFVRYLLTREVQSYLSREAYEIPMIPDAPAPPGMAALSSLRPPQVDLTQLADFRPTLDLMRRAGVL
ncbi:MAG: ABC transporter substrate-binding protein [Pseudomonadota bacterium]